MSRVHFYHWTQFRHLLVFLLLGTLIIIGEPSPCFSVAQTGCTSNAVDVVFVMDTSGSMSDEFDALCGDIQTLVTDLQTRGIQVTYTILGINENRSCTVGYVSASISGATAIYQEDWGPAVRDVAVSHPWQPGATRLIIPMSDEAPYDGYPCDDPGRDREAIETASAAARRNGVRVAPILGTGYDACVQNLANDLAYGTGGQVFLSTTPDKDLANGIAAIVQSAACDSDGDGLPDDQDPQPNDPCQPNIQAVCLPPQTCGLTNTPHWDDDGDGRTDEEQQNGQDDDGDGLIDEDVGGVNCPFPAQACGVNNHRGFDDDSDGRIDEEQANGLDDDGDAYIDEDVSCPCPPQQDVGVNDRQTVDDDGDFRVDEEMDDGIDDDGDGCIDEDVGIAVLPTPAACPPPQTVGVDDTPGVDDDNDGQTDEEYADSFDNDEDGCIDEDVRIGMMPAVTPPPGKGVTTVLLLDISGSMANPWQGGLKIESAKEAATKVVNIIEQDGRLPDVTEPDQVAVVTFSTGAQLNFGPSTDYDGARATIAGLKPLDKTNLGAGLEAANQALQFAPADGKKNIFLLSDGKPSEGLTASEILAGPVQAAQTAGACIYTIGFGDRGDLDEPLLQQIADQTGCGSYYYASELESGLLALENGFIRNRHQSVRTIVAEHSGVVRQDETTPPTTFQVESNQEVLVATINWPGGKVELILTDPGGRQVDENYPGVQVTVFAGLEYLAVENPSPGNWRAAALGQEVPGEEEPFNVVVSTKKAASILPLPSGGSGAAFAIFLAVLLGAVGTTAFFALRNRRSDTDRPGLRVIAGQASPPWAGFRHGQLGIGRGRENEMVIADKDTSRRHARILQTPQGYLLEDLGSTNGTYVNRDRVERQMLRDGDVIQVGRTQFRFDLKSRPRSFLKQQ